MKLYFILAIVVFLLPKLLSAQQISGIVKDENSKELQGASIALKKLKDSSVVKLAISRNTGNFQFTDLLPDSYFITASFIGYADKNSSPFELTEARNISIPDILLARETGNLNAVTVVSKKPLIEMKADMMVLNVESSINAVGQDALELLRKSPGVTVDKDDNLSLSGKNGVQVYIDGRPTPLAGKDLSSYLKSLQSSSIEAIEIITNPSAKYEAAGNAGIINIRLKKNRSYGTNGSVNAGYAIGMLYPQYNAGFSLNKRNAKVNVFGTYNYNYNRDIMYMDLYRLQLDTLFDQHSGMTYREMGHNIKAGIDYFFNSKSTFGILLNGNFATTKFKNLSKTAISYNPDKNFLKTLVADNAENGRRSATNMNVNYRYADTAGKTFNVDADYGFYHLRNNQMQPNHYYHPSGDPLESRIYFMLAPTDIDIYTIKSDYEQNFKKGRLSTGAKISYVKTLNDFQRYNVVNNVKDLDKSRSNDFNYTENINAAYLNYNRPFKKITIQAGVRVEQTMAKGVSNGLKWNGNSYEAYDSAFKRNYTDLFPSGAITFTKDANNQFSLTFSRRIDRPAYQDLNPFEFKLDEYTYRKGNTELRPQYTNSVGLSHTYKYKLTTSFNYSHVNDVFTQLIDTAEKSKSFITNKNLATQDIMSLNISYPLQISWYSMYANLNTYYSHFKADLGVGRKIDLDVYAYNINMQHSAKFAKTWTAELSGWYSSPSLWQGTFENEKMWSIDAGIQKILFKGKGNLKASLTDVFKTMQWAGVSNFAGQYLRASGGWDSRQFKLNFTYRFGSTQITEARQRKTGLEDESQRVKTKN